MACNKLYSHELQSQTKVVGKVAQLNSSPFNLQILSLLNIPRPLFSMLEYNRTITRTDINILLNIGPGVGGGGKKEVKSSRLLNTFDDDCSLLRQHRGREGLEKARETGRLTNRPFRVGCLEPLFQK